MLGEAEAHKGQQKLTTAEAHESRSLGELRLASETQERALAK